MNELLDTRTADMTGVSADALRKLAAMVESRLAELVIEFKTAVIASDDLPFGLARLYEMVSDESPEAVHVFRAVPPALEWLNVPSHLLA